MDSTIIETPNQLIGRIILEKRAFFIDSLEAYNRVVYKNGRADIYEVRTRLKTLFEELKPGLTNTLSPEEFNDLEDSINNGSPASVLEAWDIINGFIYNKGLTDIFKKEEIL